MSILYSADGVSWSTLATVSSGSDGSYSYTCSNIPAGSYFIKASWLDNDYYNEATSGTVSLTVSQQAETPFPATILIIVVVIIVVMVIALILVLKRKPKPAPPPPPPF